MPDVTEHAGERTEMPTPLRLEEARRQGRVAKSGELAAAAATLAGLAATAAMGEPAVNAIRRMLAVMLAEAGQAHADWSAQAAGAAWEAVGWVGAILLAVVLAAVVANVAQFGLLMSGEPVKAKLTRLSPLAGLGRMFSLRAAFRGGLSVAKLGVAAVVVYATVRAALPASGSAWPASVEELAGRTGKGIASTGLLAAAAMAALAVVDLVYQRWQYRQDLKMTRQEYLDDLRRMEGSRLRPDRPTSGTRNG